MDISFQSIFFAFLCILYMFDLGFWTLHLFFTYVFVSIFGIASHLVVLAELTALFHSGCLGEDNGRHR